MSLSILVLFYEHCITEVRLEAEPWLDLTLLIHRFLAVIQSLTQTPINSVQLHLQYHTDRTCLESSHCAVAFLF